MDYTREENESMEAYNIRLQKEREEEYNERFKHRSNEPMSYEDKWGCVQALVILAFCIFLVYQCCSAMREEDKRISAAKSERVNGVIIDKQILSTSHCGGYFYHFYIRDNVGIVHDSASNNPTAYYNYKVGENVIIDGFNNIVH